MDESTFNKTGKWVCNPFSNCLTTLFLLSLALSSGCRQNDQQTTHQAPTEHKRELQEPAYAKRFFTRQHPKGTEILVLYGSSFSDTLRYLAKARQKDLEDPQGFDGIIPTPVRSAVILSSTQAGAILELGANRIIKGFPDKEYLYDKTLRERIDNGEIEEVGMGNELDIERVVEIAPDILISDDIGMKRENAGTALESAGVPLFLNLDWQEKHPLGRAEWIKVYGILLEQREKAKNIFQRVRKEYEQLGKKVRNLEDLPKILCNISYKGSWYVPGGDSYMATLIETAGGTYPWAEMRNTGGIRRSLEEVLAKASDARIWINPGSAKSLEDITSRDDRLRTIKAVQEEKVFNNIGRKEAGRGNDYWESGAVHPERVLEDLIRIFHPSALPEGKLFYFKKLPKRPTP